MKICLVTPELPPATYGGIGRYVADLASQYWQRGHEVTVLGVGIHTQSRIQHSWGQSISLSDHRQATAKGSTMMRVARGVSRLPGGWRGGHYLAAIDNCRQHSRRARIVAQYFMVNRGRFDIVEASNWLGRSAFLRRGTETVVVRLSSPAVECSEFSSRVNSLEAQACQRADLVIGNSRAILTRCSELYGIDPRNCIVIPHGVEEIAHVDCVRSGEALDLLCVGRCEPRKGTDILAASLPQLLAKYLEVRVTFIGFEADDLLVRFPQLDGIWRKLLEDFPDRVRCPGKVSDEEVQSYYRRSHWVVIPSRFESFGLVAIEALRAGTPFLASASGGLNEIAAQAPECRLVSPNEVEEWTNALSAIVEEGIDSAEALRSICRQRYLTKFTAGRMADQSLVAYEELLKARGGQPLSKVVGAFGGK